MGTRVTAEEGMGSMDKGRHRYAKGDYAGALVAFSEVSASPSRFALVPYYIAICIVTQIHTAILGRPFQSSIFYI